MDPLFPQLMLVTGPTRSQQYSVSQFYCVYTLMASEMRRKYPACFYDPIFAQRIIPPFDIITHIPETCTAHHRASSFWSGKFCREHNYRPRPPGAIFLGYNVNVSFKYDRGPGMEKCYETFVPPRACKGVYCYLCIAA